MNYCMQKLRIYTNVTEDEIKDMTQPIVAFANKHEIALCIGFTDKNECVSYCAVEGKRQLIAKEWRRK